MDALEQYLDRAARSERAFVRIVHGHGNGVLRKAVRDYLKSSNYDIKWRVGTPQEGGEGCTVVEFT
jgi:DNA mismatch repair protein MutS2